MSADTSGASDSFMSGSDAQKQQILNKKFKILGEIYIGGIKTYKAIDLQSGKTVAIKMLPGCLVKKVFDEVFLKSRPCFKLSHPNIIGTHDLLADGEQQYFVTEHVDGVNLEQRIFSRGIFSVAEAVEIFSQVAEALDFAHRQHIYHGDMKLPNIIITKDGKAKLAGFGISAAMEAIKKSASGQKYVEPPFYQSPECVSGGRPDSPSDVYSLAAVIYECFCGHPPFWGSSIEQQILKDKPAALDGLSEKQNAAILKALSKNPSDRQRTATELVKQLAEGLIKQTSEGRAKKEQRISAAESIEQPPSPVKEAPDEKDKQKNKRKKVLVLSTVFAVIILTIIVGISGWSSHKRHERELEAGRLWQQAQSAAAKSVYNEAITITDHIIIEFPEYKSQHLREITERKREWENAFGGQQSWFAAKTLAEQKKYKEAIAAGKTFFSRYPTSQYVNEAKNQIKIWERILLEATNAELLTEARKFSNAGELDKAENNVAAILRTDPKNTDAQSLKQEIYSLKEAKRTAAERQTKFQELKQKGIALQNAGKWQEAIDNYRKAVEINTDAGDLKDRIDICQHDMYAKQREDAEHKGDVAGAINSYEKALTYKYVTTTKNKLESAKERLRIEQEQTRARASVYTQAGDHIVVIVNGNNITEAEVDEKVGTYIARIAAQIPPNMTEQYKKQIRSKTVESIIVEKLLDEQIKKAGINITESDVDNKLNEIIAAQPGGMTMETFKAMLVAQGQSLDQTKEQVKKTMGYEKLLGPVEVRDAEARAFYEANKEDFNKSEEVRASHILVKVESTATPEQKAAAKAKINRLLKQIKAGGDFAVLAKENSDCPSKTKGGDLGFFDRGAMVKEFADAAFAMKVGQVSDVVETQFGYHIIKVTDRRETGLVSFEKAKADIVKSLQDKKKGEIFKQLIEKIKTDAKIVYPPEKPMSSNDNSAIAAGSVDKTLGAGVIIDTSSVSKRDKANPQKVQGEIDDLLKYGRFNEAIKKIRSELMPAYENQGDFCLWKDVREYILSCGRNYPGLIAAGALQFEDLQRTITRRTEEQAVWRETWEKLRAIGDDNRPEIVKKKLQILDSYINNNYLSFFRPIAERQHANLRDQLAVLRAEEK